MTPKKEWERIAVLETKQDNVTQKLTNIEGKIDDILNRFDTLESKFVLRQEFKVAIGVISALAILIGIVINLTDK